MKVTRKEVISLILGIIFAFGLMAGHSFQLTGSLKYYYASRIALGRGIIIWIIISIFFTIFLYKIYSCRFWIDGIRLKYKSKKISEFIFEKHPWGVPFIILFVCWLPYVIFLFPGTISWDGFEALTGAFRYIEWTNHHPAISSWFMRLAIEIGRKIGNETYGFFLYNMIQILLQAAVFSGVFYVMKKKKTWYPIRWITLVWYGFFSVWPTNGYAMNKDTMYYIVFTLYILLTIEFVKKAKKNIITWKQIVIYIAVMILLCIFRNNGIYVVLLTIPCLLIATGKKQWKKVLILLVCMVLYNSFYNQIFLPMVNIQSGSEREIFSVPFQQTARYVKEHPEEVTTEEADAIRGVLDYDHLAELYNPELSDNVKWTYKDEASKNEKKLYIKTWFNQFLKHPLTYLEATLNNTYRYFDPLQEEFYGGTGGEYEISGPDFYREHFAFKQNSIFSKERDGLQKMAEFIKGIPGIGVLYGTGIYTWVLLFLMGGVLVSKQYEKFTFLIPLLITLLICIVSPVNGCMRYILPIMSSLPIIIGIILYTGEEEAL